MVASFFISLAIPNFGNGSKKRVDTSHYFLENKTMNRSEELTEIINANQDAAELGCSISRGLVIQALAELEDIEWHACMLRDQEWQDQRA